MSIESVMPSNHLILCPPLLLPPSILPSIRVFSNKSVLHIRWPKYWASASASVLSMISFRMISFRMDWLDLLAVQGILKSLLQHHRSKASVTSVRLGRSKGSQVHKSPWSSAFLLLLLTPEVATVIPSLQKRTPMLRKMTDP